MMRTLFVVFVLLFSFTSFAETALSVPTDHPFTSKPSQLDVIINYDRTSTASREFYIILYTINKAQQDYDANPGAFVALVEPGEPARQLTRDEVVSMRYSQLVADGLISYAPNLPDSLEAGLKTVPHIDPFLADLYVEGNPPLTIRPEMQIESPGTLFYELTRDTGTAGNLLRDNFRRLFGIDIEENLLLRPELKGAISIHEQNRDGTLLKNEMAKVNAQMESFRKMQLQWNQELQAAKTKEEKDKFERERIAAIEYKRSEVTAGLNIASSFLGIAGDQKGAKLFADASKIASIGFTIQSGVGPDGLPLGPVATANLYVAGAAIAMSMLSNGGQSEMAAVMEQLQAIFDLLNDIRKEMHQRFDIVDMKLNYLIFRIDAGLQALQNSTGRIEDNLADIQIAIEDQKNYSKDLISALYDRISYINISFCLPRHNRPNPALTYERFYDCIVGLDDNMNKYSIFGIDAIAEGDQSIENVYVADFGFPYVSSLQRLAHLLRHNYKVPLSGKIINPHGWNKNAHSLIQIWSSYPEFAKLMGPQDIQNAINVGESIQDFYGSLALTKSGTDRKVVNIPLFEKLLVDYKTLVVQNLDWLRSAAQHYNTQFKFNPALTAPLTPEEMPISQQTHISACQSASEFGVENINIAGSDKLYAQPVYNVPYLKLSSIQKNWDNYSQLKRIKNIPVHNLPFWISAFNSLPPELISLEKQVSGSVSLCLRRYIIKQWTQSGATHTAQLEFTLDAQILGVTVATSNTKLEIINENEGFILKAVFFPQVVFANSIVPSAFPWATADFSKLLSIYWMNHTPDTGFPIGVTSRNFSDLSQWQPLFNTAAIQQEVSRNIMHDPAFKNARTQLHEVRNIMRVILDIGLSQAAPQKIEAQSLFRDVLRVEENGDALTFIDPVGIRSLDTIMEQYITARFTDKQILEQIDSTNKDLLDKLKAMNASDVDLAPRNAAIDQTIGFLNTLLAM